VSILKKFVAVEFPREVLEQAAPGGSGS
jgi:hypothetical protein